MQTLNRFSSKAVCGLVGRGMDLLLPGFPPVVRIETTNACNARCTICPHRRLRRPIRRMEEALFVRVVDECATAGCRQIHLHNFGEPLLDSDLAERIRYAKRQGIRKVKIFTNGSLLSESKAVDLIESGLDEIKISVDGSTREEFEQIRTPLKFDQVLENVARLVTLRNIAQSPMQIHVACCSTSDRHAPMLRSLARIVDGFAFARLHNWAAGDGAAIAAGRAPSKMVRKPCARLWRTLTVLAGGEVALCCLDYEGHCLLGHLGPNTTIREVWHGAAYREARRRHVEGKQAAMELCAQCSKSYL